MSFTFPKHLQSPLLTLSSPAAAEVQWPPDWSALTTYGAGDFCWSASHWFRSKSAGNINHSPTIGGDAYWDDLSSPAAWAAATGYSAGDVRSYNGHVFSSPNTHTSAAAWGSGQSYVAGDVRVSVGLEYVCILAHTSAGGNAPPDTTYWSLDRAPVAHIASPASDDHWSNAHPFPYDFEVAGTWTAEGGDLVSMRIGVTKDSDPEYIEEDDSFAPCASYDFSETISIRGTGTWTIRLEARTATGLISEDYLVLTAVGSFEQVAKPKFYQHGKRLGSDEWDVYGKLKLKSKSDEDAIYFRFSQEKDGVRYGAGPWHTYDPSGDSYTDYPIGYHPTDNFNSVIESYAVKSGLSASNVRRLTIHSKRVSLAEVV